MYSNRQEMIALNGGQQDVKHLTATAGAKPASLADQIRRSVIPRHLCLTPSHAGGTQGFDSVP